GAEAVELEETEARQLVNGWVGLVGRPRGAAPPNQVHARDTTLVSASEAYRLWAATLDAEGNALVALETRYLTPMLGGLHGKRFLDVACGTGRWLLHAHAQGAIVAGVDFCREMLLQAGTK